MSVVVDPAKDQESASDTDSEVSFGVQKGPPGYTRSRVSALKAAGHAYELQEVRDGAKRKIPPRDQSEVDQATRALPFDSGEGTSADADRVPVAPPLPPDFPFEEDDYLDPT